MIIIHWAYLVWKCSTCVGTANILVRSMKQERTIMSTQFFLLWHILRSHTKYIFVPLSACALVMKQYSNSKYVVCRSMTIEYWILRSTVSTAVLSKERVVILILTSKYYCSTKPLRLRKQPTQTRKEERGLLTCMHEVVLGGARAGSKLL